MNSAVSSDVNNDVFLFDADAHVLEPPDLWENYLEAEFQQRAIKFEKMPRVLISFMSIMKSSCPIVPPHWVARK